VSDATPITTALRAYLADGGTWPSTTPAGTRLIEALERGVKSAGRGSRLPADWTPSAADIAFALDRGMRRDRVDAEAEKFRNYWLAKSGAGAVKRDWPATWRNWTLSALERFPNAGDRRHERGTIADAIMRNAER
jgi:hypothetical protein